MNQEYEIAERFAKILVAASIVELKEAIDAYNKYARECNPRFPPIQIYNDLGTAESFIPKNIRNDVYDATNVPENMSVVRKRLVSLWYKMDGRQHETEEMSYLIYGESLKRISSKLDRLNKKYETISGFTGRDDQDIPRILLPRELEGKLKSLGIYR